MPICLNRPRFDLTITQASTFSGARQALLCVTMLQATLKTRSLLLLATGMGKITFTKKARRGRDSCEVFPCQGFGDLGYDGLGLGAGGHAGDKKISKIKQSFQTCQGSVQQSTEVIYI